MMPPDAESGFPTAVTFAPVPDAVPPLTPFQVNNHDAMFVPSSKQLSGGQEECPDGALARPCCRGCRRSERSSCLNDTGRSKNKTACAFFFIGKPSSPR